LALKAPNPEEGHDQREGRVNLEKDQVEVEVESMAERRTLNPYAWVSRRMV
jgi:hypothetical protein